MANLKVMTYHSLFVFVMFQYAFTIVYQDIHKLYFYCYIMQHFIFLHTGRTSCYIQYLILEYIQILAFLFGMHNQGFHKNICFKGNRQLDIYQLSSELNSNMKGSFFNHLGQLSLYSSLKESSDFSYIKILVQECIVQSCRITHLLIIYCTFYKCFHIVLLQEDVYTTSAKIYLLHIYFYFSMYILTA